MEPIIQGIGYIFSKHKVALLDRSGLSNIRDSWDFENNQPLHAMAIAQGFKLDQREVRAMKTMTYSIPYHKKDPVQQSHMQTPLGRWVGCFENNKIDTHPKVIFQSNRLFRPTPDKHSWAPFQNNNNVGSNKDNITMPSFKW